MIGLRQVDGMAGSAGGAWGWRPHRLWAQRGVDVADVCRVVGVRWSASLMKLLDTVSDMDGLFDYALARHLDGFAILVANTTAPEGEEP